MKVMNRLSSRLVIVGVLVFAGWLGAQMPAVEPEAPPADPEAMQMPAMGIMGLPNLTDAQKEQIQTLRIKHLKEALPIETDIKVKELELGALWQVDKLDTKAIVAKVKEIADLRTKLELAKVNHRIEIYKILTPEQRKMLGREFGLGRGMRQRMQKRLRQMHQRHLEPMGPENCPHR